MRYIYLLLTLAFSFTLAFTQPVSTAPNQFANDEFPGSGGVKIGPDGHIYIGNYGDALPNSNGTQVWRYHLALDSLELFATGLSGASGNDFDSHGNLFQANIAGNRISKITPAGSVSTFATGLSAPVGVVVDDKDELYVCNCGNNTIAHIDTAGNVSTFASGTLFACPNGITQDHHGNLFVSNFNNGTVIKIDTAGTPILFATAPGSNNGHLTYSAADSMLYLASHGASRIYRINSFGSLAVVAGSGIRGNANGPTASATFSRPNGIAVSVTGDTMYINSSIPTSNTGFPLNPSLLRIITGLKTPVGIQAPFEAFAAVRIAPSPVLDRGWVEIDLLQAQSGWLRIVDLEGRLVHEELIDASVSGQLVRRELPANLGAGLHLLSFETGQGRIMRRFVVVK